MKNYKKSESIFIIWKSPRNRKNYLVGRVTKNQNYEFIYEKDLSEAEREGFVLFIPFQNRDEKYENKKLFPIFSNRLPDRRRKDIENILKKYDLKTYDEFQLLKAGAELPVDNLKFVPAIDSEEDLVNNKISLAGVRHYLDCEKDCDKVKDMMNEYVDMELEPDNEVDKYAVKIKYENKTIGYIPRYYNELIFNLIEKGKSFKIKVVNVRCDKNCDKCVEVEVKNN